MAHHASAKKRIRQTAFRRLRNRYYGKTTRNALRAFRNLSSRKEAQATAGKVISMIDKLAKRGVIHKNKASNLKSGIARRINALQD
jgi:small subunit ribosomal protein S20